MIFISVSECYQEIPDRWRTVCNRLVRRRRRPPIDLMVYPVGLALDWLAVRSDRDRDSFDEPAPSDPAQND